TTEASRHGCYRPFVGPAGRGDVLVSVTAQIVLGPIANGAHEPCAASRFMESSALGSSRDARLDVATLDDRQDAQRTRTGGPIMSDTTTASAESAVRPFRIEVPQGEIDELRRRINATRWPTRELVTDRAQGVQLAAIQNLA